MSRIAPQRRPQAPTSPRKVQDNQASRPHQGLDLLVLSIGDDHGSQLSTWKSTCNHCQMGYGHLEIDQQPGRTIVEKVQHLMTTLRDWATQGRIDPGTQIMVLTHGTPRGNGLALSDRRNQFVIPDGGGFLQDLRTTLGTTDTPWAGMIFLGACAGSVLRRDFKHGPGHTIMLGGQKTVLGFDLTETFDKVLRSQSTEPRSSEAPTLQQVRSIWNTAREHCGEHISWSGGGSMRTHKAGNFDFESRPLPEKHARVLYAKLEHGSVEAVKRVAGQKLQIRRPDYPPLSCAAYGKRDTVEKMEFLIESGQQVNEQDKAYGETALRIACEAGNLQAVQTLLKHGADPWIGDNDGFLPWHFASGKVLELLVTDPAATPPAKPAAPDPDAFPLHAACANGKLLKVKELLANASFLRAKDPQGNTALGVALLHRRLDVAQLLLEKGAQTNALLANGDALLAHAVLHGQTAAVRLLLMHGAKPDRADRHGMPLLLRAMHAVHAGRADIDLLELVLSTSAGEKTLNEGRALHYACHLDAPKLAQILLERGADPGQCDGDGTSATDLINDLTKTRAHWNSFELKVALMNSMLEHGI